MWVVVHVTVCNNQPIAMTGVIMVASSFSRRRAFIFFALVLLVMVFGGITTITPAYADTNTGVYSGTVFRDYDNDGTLDASEPGIGGVTITAYNNAGAAGSVVSTAGTGAFSFTPTGSGAYRFELSGYPASLYPAVAGGTTVQFRTDGGATGLNFGLQSPNDYCQANPNLCTPISPANNVAGQGTRSEPAFMLFPYSASGTTPAPTLGAPANTIGSTWGVASQPTRQRIYVTAAVKRHSGLGTEGLDGLYVLDYNGQLVSSHSVTGGGINLGTLDRSTNSNYTLPVNPQDSSIDLDAFDKVGRVGFGDVDTSDANTLWMVNLNQNALIRANISGAPGSYTQFNITAPSCPTYTLQRIAAGSAGFVDARGREWVGDQGFVSGSGVEFTPGAGYNPGTIANTNSSGTLGGTSDARLYQSARLNVDDANLGTSDEVHYAIPVPNATYNIVLHFAETGGATNAGGNQRVMDINAEGATSNNYNIYAQAGNAANRAVTVTYNNRVVSDGVLNIDLVPDGSSNYGAMISGIEFIRTSGTAPTLASGTWHPWALKFRDGFGYVGGVCNAENSLRSDQLTAQVLRFDPANPGGGFTQILDINLNYPRERYGFIETQAYWNGWASTWDDLRFVNNPPDPGATFYEWSNAQPILSDIEFADDGDMILGFMDRFGNQIGAYNSPALAGQLSDRFGGDAGGDTLHACYNAAANSYTIEGTTGCVIDNDGSNIFPRRNNDGPGGVGEFYWQDTVANSTPEFHTELTLGALAVRPGLGEVVSTVFDPLAENFTQGTHWYNTSTGARTDAWEGLDFGYDDGESSYGKAGGTGDLELLCLAAPIQIGNYIWLDSDGDGVQDGGETGIANVTVNLYNSSGTVISTANTNAAGQYLFTLDPYTYPAGTVLYVGIAPAEFDANGNLDPDGGGAGAPIGAPTTPNTGQGSNADLNDSDYTQSVVPSNPTVWGAQVTIGGPGQNNHTYDVGIAPTVSIGRNVWYDADLDGLIDAGEPGIANVSVQLYLDANNNNSPDSTTPLATTTTNAAGEYAFYNLAPGNYIVAIPASNFNAGQPLQGAIGTLINGGDPDSDVDNNDNNGTTRTLTTLNTISAIFANAATLSIGGEPLADSQLGGSATGVDSNGNGTVDFGFVPTMAIGNFVWQDSDGDGTQDGGEPGVANVAVACYLDADNNGTPDSTTPSASTTTNGSGIYTCSGLTPGNYVVVILGTNFNAGGPLNGALCSLSGGDPDTNASNTDSNGNAPCVQTLGGVNGVFASATTLAPNSEPTGDAVSGSPLGTTNAGDSNGNGTVDFGFVASMAIGNFVWQDTDADGVQDGGEPGVANVAVNCYLDANNDGIPDSTTPVATTTTNGSGIYTCSNLTPNNYVVVILGTNFNAGQPLNGALCTTNGGDPDTNASNTDSNGSNPPSCIQTLGGVNGVFTSATTLTINGEPTGDSVSGGTFGTTNAGDSNGNGTVDFGFVPSMSIGNFVWQDTNNNGTQDGGEPGIPNVVVNCYTDANNDGIPDSTTPVATSTTNGSGIYTCTNLTPGNYVVVIPSTNFNSGSSLNGAVCSASGGDPDTNASNTDSNGNPPCVQTQGGVSGVFTSATTVTTNGEPTGDSVSGGTFGTTNSGDSNGNGTVDFGFVPGLAIGNFVWIDSDNDGTQDAGEPGIPNVAVACYLDANNDGTPDSTTPVATTTTNGTGIYTCSNLTPNNYVVVILGTNFNAGQPLNGAFCSVSGGDPDGNASNTDSNGNAPCVQTLGGVNGVFASATTLSVNGEPTGDAVSGSPLGTTNAGDSNGNGTVDFGFVPGLAIGNFVWQDSDGDGTQDAGEPGIPNVAVACYLDANNDGTPDSTTPVSTTTTNGTGIYTCSGLTPNNYVVVILGTNFNAGQPLNGALCSASGGDPDGNASNTDSNGNAPCVQTLGGVNGVFASATTLSVNGEPTGDAVSGSPLGTTNSGDSNGNGTVDFGFVAAMAIGNYIWEDTDADGVQDAGEPPIANVAVACYLDANNNGAPDSTTPVATSTTNAGGLYVCNNLPPNTYVVVVAGTNFNVGGPLNNASCSPPGGDPDTNPSNTDSNTTSSPACVQTLGGVNGAFSNPVTLVINTEPTGDAISGSTFGTTNAGDSNGNGTVDFGFFGGALSVTLNYFETQCRSTDVLATWETASEIGTLGFNVYRSLSPDTVGDRLNAELIPSQSPGGGQGASYEYTDLTVTEGNTYYYTLEALGLDGSTQQFGPVDTTFPCTPTAVSLATLSVASTTLFDLPVLAGFALLALAGLVVALRRR
jgi:hypothetical protein